MYARCLVPSGAQLDAAALTMRVAEAEFAFRMARDLPAGVVPSRGQVLAAVGALVLAIEVPDSRFDDLLNVGLPSMLADALCCGFLVLGAELPAFDPGALPGMGVRMRANGEVVSEGRGEDVLGDPIDALVWLAGHLAECGEALRAGDLVTTGACTPANPVAPGDQLVAEFDELGDACVSFAQVERES
jgi:2-keto-4-pentenoate hydratase